MKIYIISVYWMWKNKVKQQIIEKEIELEKWLYKIVPNNNNYNNNNNDKQLESLTKSL